MSLNGTKLLGSFLIASGILSFGFSMLLGYLIATGQDPVGSGVGRIPGYVLSVGIYVCTVTAGVLLLRGHPSARNFARLALYPQIPVVYLGHFSYAIMLFPQLEWLWWPLFGVQARTAVRMAITIDARDRPFHIGINLVAVMLLIWLEEYSKERASGQRLAS